MHPGRVVSPGPATFRGLPVKYRKLKLQLVIVEKFSINKN